MDDTRHVTPEEMREIDRRAIEDFGIPGLVLMENAGRNAFFQAADMATGKSAHILCACGKGNNGGDGFVCARHLANNGYDVTVFLAGNPDDLKGDARTNGEICRRMDLPFFSVIPENTERFRNELGSCSLVVDAFLGTGLSGRVREPFSTLITLINEAKKPVLALDTPSGLDAGDGRILGTCVTANRTVTFGLPKTGFLQNGGPSVTGRVIVAEISVSYTHLRAHET